MRHKEENECDILNYEETSKPLDKNWKIPSERVVEGRNHISFAHSYAPVPVTMLDME